MLRQKDESGSLHNVCARTLGKVGSVASLEDLTKRRSAIKKKSQWSSVADFDVAIEEIKRRCSQIKRIEPDSVEQEVAKGNLVEVKLLLGQNPKLVEAKGRLNRTPLYWAALKGHIEIVKLLLDSGADVNAKDNYGHTALYNAATEGHVDILRLLLAKGANINVKANPTAVYKSKTALKTVVIGVRIPGEYKDWTDDPGNLARGGAISTPLSIAAARGHREIVAVLLANGAEINYKSIPHGFAAIHSAAQGGHSDIVKLFLDNGANLEAKTDAGGETPLGLVAERSNTAVVKSLLELGANVNAKNKYGRTPLYRATSFYGNKEIAEMLISSGSDVNVKDNIGYTPLHWAVIGGRQDMVALLLGKGAKVNSKDSNGRTALHTVANMDPKSIHSHAKNNEYDPNDVAWLLLSAGANVNSKDNKGNTPLQLELAMRRGHSDLADLLRKHSGDVNDTNTK